ncbi:longitudinals lacking protein, isoforms J/P/Q/S/Z-like [Rhynchophorus ferrugineus]|uniref:C2H2-type domain-containing protein n=1 Tax=Rhynchophorus ferrugineus TaxID=354439 RepID=A0A834M8N5_RHYFE|nr:hypothetical protein GWI33_014875 [Rhynchophorus ferrugineus]
MYACPRCGKTYTKQNSYYYHVKKFCGIPPSFFCPIPACQFKSHLKCNLKKHVINVHTNFDRTGERLGYKL